MSKSILRLVRPDIAAPARFKLRLRNAAQIVLVAATEVPFKTGKEMDQVDIVENGSIVVDQDGVIVAVGSEQELAKLDWYTASTYESDVDATGKSVIPGFVDGHTHPVWSGDRVHEFAMKLAGATYMDVHKAGGGIGFTVRHTRESTEKDLQDLLVHRLNRMLRYGTTLVEAKSGYGLEVDTEVKMLKVLHEVGKHHPVQIVSTFLGAHSVPKGVSCDQYASSVVADQLSKIIELNKRGELSVRNIDVFHEKGVFEGPETRKILEAGKEAGLLLNFHGDELHPMQSAELGAELDACAISHLEEISSEGIQAMAKKGVCAVLLPTTAYVLRIKPPPARDLISAGVPVALGSDFNPNAHCMSMPHVMNLACVTMRMTMNEALVAATLNSAASLKESGKHGSLIPGKWANLIVIDNPKWEHIIYEMVDPPIQSVIVRGQVQFPK